MKTSMKVLAVLGVIAILVLVGLWPRGNAGVTPLTGGVKTPLEERGKKPEKKSPAKMGELSNEKRSSRESGESDKVAESGAGEHVAANKKQNANAKNKESGEAASSAKEPSKQEASKQEPPKQETQKQESAKSEASKQESQKQELAKSEAPKQESQKQEPAKSEAAKQESQKREPAKSEAPKQESQKQEPAKSEASKQESQKQELAKSEAPKKDAQKPEESKPEESKPEESPEEASRHGGPKRGDEPGKSAKPAKPVNPLKRVESIYPTAATLDNGKIVILDYGRITYIDTKTGKLEEKVITSGDAGRETRCWGLFFTKEYLYSFEQKRGDNQPLHLIRRKRDLSGEKIIWTAPPKAGFSTILYDEQAMYIPMYDESTGMPGCTPFAQGDRMSFVKVQLSDGKETVLAKTDPNRREIFLVDDFSDRQILVTLREDLRSNSQSSGAGDPFRYKTYLVDVDKAWPQKPFAENMSDGSFSDGVIYGLFPVGGGKTYEIAQIKADGNRKLVYTSEKAGNLYGSEYVCSNADKPVTVVDLKTGKSWERKKPVWSKGLYVSIQGGCGKYLLVGVSRGHDSKVGFILEDDYQNAREDRILYWH